MNVHHRGSSYNFSPMDNPDDFVTELSAAKSKIVHELLNRPRPLASKFGPLKVHVRPLQLIKALLQECSNQSIPVIDVRMIGGAASYVVAVDEFQPIEFNDLDINIYTTATKEQFEVIRTIVYKSFYEQFIKPSLTGSSSSTSSSSVASFSGASGKKNEGVEMAPNRSNSLPSYHNDITIDGIGRGEHTATNSSVSGSNDESKTKPKFSSSSYITEGTSANSIYALRSSSQCKICENYLSKLLIVHNQDELWSLYGFGNPSDQILDIKFVSKLRRHYEFSVDSFQVGILPLLLAAAPSSNAVCSIEPEPIFDTITSAGTNFFDGINEQCETSRVADFPTKNGIFGEAVAATASHQLNQEFSNLTIDNDSTTTNHLPLFCKYHNHDQALYHLEHRIIMTGDVENIYGGGLLKYCYLLAKNFTPDSGFFTMNTEIKMCAQFFKDLPPKQTFTDKIGFYITLHFFNLPLTLQRNFLFQLHRILHLSCDFIDSYRWMVALETIRRMIASIDLTINALQPTPYCKYSPGAVGGYFFTTSPYGQFLPSQSQPQHSNGYSHTNVNSINKVLPMCNSGVQLFQPPFHNVSAMPPPQLFPPPPPPFFNMMMFNNFSMNYLSPRSRRRYLRKRYRNKGPVNPKLSTNSTNTNTTTSDSITPKTSSAQSFTRITPENENVVYYDDEDTSSTSGNSITHDNRSVSVHTSSECIDYQTKN